MSEREFKVSRSKLFDFKIEFENVFKQISLLEKEIVNIGNQVLKMNGGGGVVFYPLLSFCNPIAPMKRSCNLNACPLCGLWYACNKFLTTECGHIFHPSCIRVHTTTSFKCAFVGYEFFFTKNGVQHRVLVFQGLQFQAFFAFHHLLLRTTLTP